MGYPCQVFRASELPAKIQADLSGRKRKLDGGARKIDLEQCELLEMLQYKCEIKEPVEWDSAVQCFAIDRMFRKCKDRKGTFMVETTAWEGKDHSPAESGTKKDDDKKPQQHYHWSSSWNGADTAR
ncbi:Fc.00g100070.m01.CDS01 [Cosmosporella sp. VM-42]